MSYQLREARPEDLEPMLALFPRLAAFDIPERRHAPDLWQGDAELLRTWSAGTLPHCFVYVAVDAAQQVVGVAMAQLRDELLSHAPSAHLEVLAVAEQAAGQGIGRALLQQIEQAAKERGATSMTLHVFQRNTRARALYQKAGYDEELIRAIKFF